MVGLLFPGQGAQAVGMGREFYEKFPSARKLFDQADSVLGVKLSKIIFEGPETELTKTQNLQPAIFVTSLAALECLRERVSGFTFQAAAGLSLGEISALAALKVFSFEEGLSLVQKRGLWMEEAASKTAGGMVSVIGLPREVCALVAQESGLEVANINAPEQVVLSGPKANIPKAVEIAQARGASRAIPLNVSGAFHSSLMKEAEEKLVKLLVSIKFNVPQGLFISNVTGTIESDPEKIKVNLGRQVTGSVEWVNTLLGLKKKGVAKFFEMAPGKVLKGLTRRIDREIAVDNIETEADVLRISASLKEGELTHAS